MARSNSYMIDSWGFFTSSSGCVSHRPIQSYPLPDLLLTSTSKVPWVTHKHSSEALTQLTTLPGIQIMDVNHFLATCNCSDYQWDGGYQRWRMPEREFWRCKIQLDDKWSCAAWYTDTHFSIAGMFLDKKHTLSPEAGHNISMFL